MSGSESLTAKPFLSNAIYDRLKFCAQVLFPALGTLYFTLAGIWGLPAAEAVVGSVVALDLCLGLILGLSTKAYNDGDAKYDGHIVVTDHDDGTKAASLILKNYEDPADIVNQKEAIFKVTHQ